MSETNQFINNVEFRNKYNDFKTMNFNINCYHPIRMQSLVISRKNPLRSPWLQARQRRSLVSRDRIIYDWNRTKTDCIVLLYKPRKQWTTESHNNNILTENLLALYHDTRLYSLQSFTVRHIISKCYQLACFFVYWNEVFV